MYDRVTISQIRQKVMILIVLFMLKQRVLSAFYIIICGTFKSFIMNFFLSLLKKGFLIRIFIIWFTTFKPNFLTHGIHNPFLIIKA